MNNKSVRWFQIAAILCGLAVVLGAFGAHGLKARLTPELLAVFEVGVRYQFYHGLALLGLSMAGDVFWQGPWPVRASLAWLLGVLVFSGSLYLLAITGLRWLGAITPIGGVALILGWGFVLLGARDWRRAAA